MDSRLFQEEDQLKIVIIIIVKKDFMSIVRHGIIFDGLCLVLFSMGCVWYYFRWVVFDIFIDGFARWFVFGIIFDGAVRWFFIWDYFWRVVFGIIFDVFVWYYFRWLVFGIIFDGLCLGLFSMGCVWYKCSPGCWDELRCRWLGGVVRWCC